jgi:hypothetical protein
MAPPTLPKPSLLHATVARGAVVLADASNSDNDFTGAVATIVRHDPCTGLYIVLSRSRSSASMLRPLRSLLAPYPLL